MPLTREDRAESWKSISSAAGDLKENVGESGRCDRIAGPRLAPARSMDPT